MPGLLHSTTIPRRGAVSRQLVLSLAEPLPPPELARRLALRFARRSRRLSAAPVTHCAAVLLEGSVALCASGWNMATEGTATTQWPPLIALANALCAQARQRLGEGKVLSEFSTVAVEALATAVFEAGTGGARQVIEVPCEHVVRSFGAFAANQRLDHLALCYLGHYFQHLFWHLIDEACLRGDEGVPRFASAEHSQLRDAVGLYCLQVAHDRLREPCQRLFAPGCPLPTVPSSLRSMRTLIDLGLQSLMEYEQ